MIPVRANTRPDNRASLQDADCKPFLAVAEHIAGVTGAFIAPPGIDPANSFCFPLELHPNCYGQLCIPATLPDGLTTDQRKALENLAEGMARVFATKRQFAAHNGSQAALTAEAQEKLDKQREFYE